MTVLYEDNHVIVVKKPVNVPTQSDSSKDTDLLTMVKGYIKEKYNKPGEVYLGMVHRLDRPVGGVVVFARTSKAAARLTDAFKAHSAKKRYVAVVAAEQVTAETQRLSCYIKKDEKTHSALISDTERDGYKQAVMEYSLASVSSGLALLDIDLKTGRHHQIRAQLAHAGMPIVGDHRYNPAYFTRNDINAALFAYSLEFPHPTKQCVMRFTAVPDAYPFSMFKNELRALCAGAHLVYIDENILIVDKPTGVEVAAADAPETSLQSRLEREFSNPLYPVHRLDATTSGLVTFARTPRAQAELAAAFSHEDEKRVAHKFYSARVVGVPKQPEATLCAYLDKDEKSATVCVYDKPYGNVKPITTRYRLIRSQTVCGTVVSDLDVELLTGRTHQIRAHLAHIGCPIVGDDKYGDRAANKAIKCQTPALRAVRVTFNFDKQDLLGYLNNKTFGL